jgi:hypothetical protein
MSRRWHAACFFVFRTETIIHELNRRRLTMKGRSRNRSVTQSEMTRGFGPHRLVANDERRGKIILHRLSSSITSISLVDAWRLENDYFRARIDSMPARLSNMREIFGADVKRIDDAFGRGCER